MVTLTLASIERSPDHEVRSKAITEGIWIQRGGICSPIVKVAIMLVKDLRVLGQTRYSKGASLLGPREGDVEVRTAIK